MSDNLVKRYRMQGDYSDWWMAEVDGDGDGDGYDDASETEWVKANDHAAALVAKDAEIARLREALEPSGDTKGAYMGEIKDPETKRMVSWTAIKMIMAMISARAALNTQHKGETP